ITMGHTIVRGRVVLEELYENPLPGRDNIVRSRSKNYQRVPTFSSIEAALEHVEGEELVFVIGGAKIYEQLLPEVDKLFVTEIHQEYEGDTYFSEYRHQIGSVWKEIKRDEHPELSFLVYKRIADQESSK